MPGRILIVDKNSSASGALEARLKRHEVTVKTAADGLVALRTADEFQPNVMLIDLNIPSLPAVEVVQRIRRQPWAKRMVVFGLTGWTRAEDRERYEKVGFDSVLVKPINYAHLSGLLRSSLGSRK
jgi:two-component system CheB/CheR fusion protein